MADETSTEETPKEETLKETTEEPVEEDTSQKTELDSYKETLKESQELLKRYKEQVSGSQAEATKLKAKVEELESKTPPKEESQLSEQDRAYRDYLKKLGMFTKDQVETMVQDRIAPFQAKEEARGKGEQKKILDAFIESKPDLAKDKDFEGSKMQQVIAKLKRITPADPFNPNASLKEDLELAYDWAFGEETNQEALSKARAKGLAEGHEAGEAKVGEGASAPSTSSKKTRTPEQEALLKEWGVDDESINKKTEKK